MDPKSVASIILGGGAGTRLFPLTGRRAKPAVYVIFSLNVSLIMVTIIAKPSCNVFVFEWNSQVPIGGCYRLIDIPMSNCINSGIRKIFILTQFNSFSLNRHLSRAYSFGNGITFGDGFVEVSYYNVLKEERFRVCIIISISKNSFIFLNATKHGCSNSWWRMVQDKKWSVKLGEKS